MIVLVAVVAAMYATAEITLAPVSFVLLPGILQFKLSDVFTMAFGALFGPAGAWGVGVGNTIGDLFTGNLAVGSIFGFLSSLAVAYVGYTLFRPVERSARGDASVEVDHGRSVALYLAVGILGAVVSAVSLAWGLELLGIAPYKVVSDAPVGNFILGSWVGAVTMERFLCRATMPERARECRRRRSSPGTFRSDRTPAAPSEAPPRSIPPKSRGTLSMRTTSSTDSQ
jgi:energy-coupling factor transport system substrate-specific component